uniref:Aspartyl/asparaginy/proline hydroxylase domain-containing protein n=1 Tax=uncultured bacterium esnapd14 TaxID=1366594 RepID=S5UBB9_9BACT|nr:RIKEN cDNA A830007L07 [uncultured bacterium esnapd14]
MTWLTDFGAGCRDFGRLLLGHSRRYRTARLQDIATAAVRHPSPARAWVVPAINQTIRARQAVTRALWLEPRRIASRTRHRAEGHAPRCQISVLCPTRERPAGLARLIGSLLRTAHDTTRIRVLCYVDNDDRQLARYRAYAARQVGAELVVGPPIGVPATWNALARAATGDVLVMANDDQFYVDYGWDLALDRAVSEYDRRYRDGVYCLYFDGGQYPDGGADFPIVSRAWYQALGYYSTEMFQQWQAERWIFDIAERIQRLHPVPGVFVDHLHYQDYKAPFDATYQRHRLTRDKSLADQALFIRMAPEREREAERLRQFITAAATPPPPVTKEKDVPGYLMQSVRRYYCNLIDAWHYGGRTGDAHAFAELAVAQGVWDHPMQRAREHVPGLDARALHDPERFWFVAYLEQHYPQIRAEIEQVLDTSIDPVRPTTDDDGLIRHGQWKQAHLFRDGRWQEQVCAHFPVTRDLLAQIPEVTTFSPGVITVSRVAPGTHIMPHCGPTNALVRVHLPIKIPPGVWIKVGGQRLVWEEGKCLIFDDSFEHEVGHEGTEDRVVLILDTLHPDLAGDHGERLRQRRLNTEEQILAFLRDGGFARVEVRDGEVAIRPGPGMHDRLLRDMRDAGVQGARLHGADVVWNRHTAGRAQEEVTRNGMPTGIPGGDRGETPAAMRHREA